MLDNFVDDEWIKIYTSQTVGQIPEDVREYFDQMYERDKGIEFYQGMLRQALNNFELVEKVRTSHLNPGEKTNKALGTVGTNLLYNIVYLASIIQEMKLVH